MIVLDEQLLGRDLDEQIAGWYRGAVCFITDLRPKTVIKDDAIPLLLRAENQPTFVTINDQDFWRQVPITQKFCVICCVLPDSQAGEIPDRLREVLKHPLFNTKKKRMGKVIRLTAHQISYYSVADKSIKTVSR